MGQLDLHSLRRPLTLRRARKPLFCFADGRHKLGLLLGSYSLAKTG